MNDTRTMGGFARGGGGGLIDIQDRTGMVQLSELRAMPYRDRIRKATEEQFAAHPDLFEKPKIYIASKAKHRPQWRELRDRMGYAIISTWIDTDDKFIDTHDQLDYNQLWRRCMDDVRSCDSLVLYVEAGEVLKGALVEIGAALALKKEVIMIGPPGDNGSWHNFDKVIKSEHETIESLMEFIYGG